MKNQNLQNNLANHFQKQLEMKNTMRSKEYMFLKRCIKSCVNYRQLEAMELMIHRFSSKGTQDGKDILLFFINAKSNLFDNSEPEYLKLSIESEQHKKLSK